MRRGFTLAEVLVALVVLAVGLTGVVAVSVTGRRVFVGAEIRELAVREARSLVDSVLAEGSVGSGLLLREWGELRWSAGGTAGLREVLVEAHVNGPVPDTLLFETARLLQP